MAGVIRTSVLTLQKHIGISHCTTTKMKGIFFEHIPRDCPVVAVELADNSLPLERYCHRERCIYLLGAEDRGIPESVLKQCAETVQILGNYCYNVAVAGSIVMYDRAAKAKEV